MNNIAIFASGNGSNFEALAKAVEDKKLNANIKILVCDKKDVKVLERAKKYNIPILNIILNDYENKEEYEKEILKKLKEENVKLIVLAGYMKLISPILLNEYENKIINIHPALLPNFPGAHGIEDAYNAGVNETGITIHYVDEGMDSGPIIYQKSIDILKEDTLSDLESKIHNIENTEYPLIIEKILNKEV